MTTRRLDKITHQHEEETQTLPDNLALGLEPHWTASSERHGLRCQQILLQARALGLEWHGVSLQVGRW